jgi:hypothetical protein
MTALCEAMCWAAIISPHLAFGPISPTAAIGLPLYPVDAI